jgi:hypothetical protein
MRWRVIIPVLVTLGTSGPSDGTDVATWNFEATPSESVPTGFLSARTGAGKEARWIVRESADAPSGRRVLVQVDVDETSARFPLLVAERPLLRDLRVAVRCKPVAGRVDQACGVVARYRDADNYYIARANALEDNVRLYRVQAGRRTQLASWSGAIEVARWYALALTARGAQLEVSWDGERILASEDAAFPDAGRAGVWTKADSLTEFDDLTITALEER